LLKEFRNRWFLFGSKADDLLLFNLPLDRMVSVEPVDVPFRDNPEFDPERFFDDVIGVSKNIHERAQCIKFWASAEQSRYIKTKPLHPSQRLLSEDATDGSCIFRIDVVINFEMYSVFMSYGPGVKIISPRRATNYMGKMLKAAAALYDQRV
jgi:predicted DNA-binding transcriptional regulator YafY